MTTYTDDELHNIRFEISRACEAINRKIDRYMDREPLRELYEQIDVQLSRMSSIVRELTRETLWFDPYVKAYNSLDQAAAEISLAMGASDDDRPSFLDSTKDHLHRTVEYLVMT
jgi:hypothetical protein